MVGIIAAAIKAAIYGIIAAQTASPDTNGALSNLEETISVLKWLYLSMICDVATNILIPRIWMEMAMASTHQEGLALLT